MESARTSGGRGVLFYACPQPRRALHTCCWGQCSSSAAGLGVRAPRRVAGEVGIMPERVTRLARRRDHLGPAFPQREVPHVAPFRFPHLCRVGLGSSCL